MKKVLITLGLLLTYMLTPSQISDALTQDTIDLWINTNNARSITGAKLNDVLTHLNTNKLHKDSAAALYVTSRQFARR